MRYGNRNHLLGRAPAREVTSRYDALAASNRPVAPQLKVASLSPEDHDDLLAVLAKTANAIGDVHSGVDKTAFLSGGIDLFTRAKGLINNKLGMTEDMANQLASPIVTKTGEIQSAYGGDPHKIMDRLVDEMQKQMMGTATAPGAGWDDIRQSMSLTKTPGMETDIKHRLIQEFGITSSESDHLAKSVMQEARDLTTAMRPFKIDAIAHAIVDIMVAHHDMSVVYNIKTNNLYLTEIKEQLGA